MSAPYEILALDDLPAYESGNHGDARLMPLRNRLGLRAFGANCWTADVGKQIVPTHEEDSGHEELYAVVRGRARFRVGEETFDAPAGTLVHVRAGTAREAFAEEAGTIVLAVGATPGEAFEAQGWDDVVVAFAEARAGNVGGGREAMRRVAARDPDHWGPEYNLACFEALFGDRDLAFEHLTTAAARNPDEVHRYLQHDSDLDSLRDDARLRELAG
jgi:mannose-6-phosphate isomerase-like protein (cupin superfamily)